MKMLNPHRFYVKCLMAGGLLASVQAVEAVVKPNVIIFLVDDMGLMDTSLPFIADSLGNAVRYPLNDWYHTPNMERMAQQGVRFSCFYAQSVSSPSRVSLLTGMNAARHHTTNWINTEENNRDLYGPTDWNWDGLKSSDYTLPRMMKDAGYKTIIIGKSHLGNLRSEGADPLNLGFDVNIAGSSIGEPGSYYAEVGYGATGGRRSRAVPGLEKYHGTHTFLTEALTIEAKAQIDTAVSEKKPFFLYMSHYAVHSPFERDMRFWNRYASAQGKSDREKAFATLVEGMDKSLGDIMDHLEAKGIAQNTLIVFMGDNGSAAPVGYARGYCASSPLRGMKGTEFEGGVRVPCIVSWGKPDGKNKIQRALPIAQGAVQTQMATIMDIYPTLAKVTGVNKPFGHVVDGQDLSGLLTGKKDDSHASRLLIHFPHCHHGSYFTTYREDDWKLIYYYNPEHPERPDCALYNLKADPFEKQDISAKNPKKTSEMIDRMIHKLTEEGAQYPVDFEGQTVRPVNLYSEYRNCMTE